MTGRTRAPDIVPIELDFSMGPMGLDVQSAIVHGHAGDLARDAAEDRLASRLGDARRGPSGTSGAAASFRRRLGRSLVALGAVIEGAPTAHRRHHHAGDAAGDAA